jgi:phosphopantothenoylcysteine decarboxylase/phosphopantothenate--cysteine ligase
MSDNKKPLVALGITGCIGAYKATELLRLLQKHGCDVQPILTDAAQRFVAPLALQTLAGRRVITGLWDEPDRVEVGHIALSDEIKLLLVAPATANIIAKFANGIADDFLSTFYLSTESPIVIAPAMNTKMWQHPATVKNIEILRERGVRFVEPGTGYLACGWEGQGRLAELEDVVDEALYAMRGKTTLTGKKILVSAGPTIEPLDPMRFISNRSSGRMGYSLAWEARARGAEVVLISGPTAMKTPYGVKNVPVRSAAEMKAAITDELDGTDILIMAAAVADFKSSSPVKSKIKKTGGKLTVELEQTDDILAWLGGVKSRPFLVGFAAETDNLLVNARKKLSSKKADLIFANPISGKEDVLAGDETQGILLASDGSEREIPRCSKADMAIEILDEVERRIGS